jgi:hypothetical protein
MNRGKMKAKTDQELQQQLEQTASGSHEVQAVFVLRPPGSSQKFLTPDQTLTMVENLLHRLQQETGESPRDYNVFKNLRSFVVAASPAFINKLLEQDEIASVMANRQPGSALIPPRNKRPV